MTTTNQERRGANLVEPLAVTIADAVKISGLSRSEIYRRAAAGDLEMLKNGSRSLITMASIKGHLAGLPRAELRAPKQAAPAQ